MAKTREIKSRIRAVGNIQRITRTMQMIATARFQAASGRVASSRPFSRKIGELVAEVSSSTGGADHPLLRAPSPPRNKHLLLVLSSNRGLCGAYNANVLRTAFNQIRAWRRAGEAYDIEVVGKKGMATMRFTSTPVARFLGHFGDKPPYNQVEHLADEYMQWFEQGHYDSVRVAYMSFISSSRQVPEVLQLLPAQAPVDEPSDAAGQGRGGALAAVEYDFSPEPRQLLDELLPMTVRVRLFQCFNEAVVSEHVARMVAMKAATDAARKLGRNLTLRYNRARQAAITTELTEIVSGAASVG